MLHKIKIMEKQYCDSCNKSFLKTNFNKHLASQKHMKNTGNNLNKQIDEEDTHMINKQIDEDTHMKMIKMMNELTIMDTINKIKQHRQIDSETEKKMFNLMNGDYKAFD